MASENLDFTEVLAVLEAKRSALDTLIANFKAAMSIGALGLPGETDAVSQQSVSNGGPVDLPTGAFLKKTIPAAITLYLSAVRKKQTVREIATAIKAGGLESTAKNFEATITGALYRLRDAEKILRFPDGWALAEFYPDRIRASVSQPKIGKKSKRRKRAKTRRTTAGVVGITSRIYDHLKTHADETFSPAEISSLLNATPPVVNMALGRLMKNGKVELEAGRYSAA